VSVRKDEPDTCKNKLITINVKPKTIKLLEENTGEKFPDISLGNSVLDMTLTQRQPKQNRQIGLN
jgi:hypothetical protein